jgi:RNA polymerase sigma-70 factor (ECF subfamily)
LASRGKQHELDAWVLATAPRAVAYAASLLRDPARAEDIVQACYCRLLQKETQYDLPNSGMRLLLKVITRACINVATRERRILSFQGFRSRDGACVWEPMDTTVQEPQRIMMHKELEEAIATGLGRLPALQRAALELKSLGHSHQQIGQMLEVTAGHAAVLVHRARRAMAAYLVPFVGEATG